MRVLTMSRFFPKGHPKAGQPTHFVEAICNSFRGVDYALPLDFLKCSAHDLFPQKDQYMEALSYQGTTKHTTIRAGERFKPGDMASLRVWSDKPYRSKQIEFAKVEVVKTWSFEIKPMDLRYVGYFLNGSFMGMFDKFDISLQSIAANDGLSIEDFISWFAIHPKKKGAEFRGQIVCWSSEISY